MVSWIEPLKMETWFVQVFAGTPEIFTAIAILVIFGIAGYLRMSLLSLFFMIGIFLLMFANFIQSPIIIIIAIIGGLLIGYTLSKFISRN